MLTIKLAIPFILAGIVVIFIVLPLRDKAKVRRRIRCGFGKPPEQKRGLIHAEDFFSALVRHSPDRNTVDDWTWNDLDGDDVFYRMNACQSAVGDARIYSALRRPPQNPAAEDGELAKRLTLANHLAQNPALRVAAQIRLARLGRLDGDGMVMTAFYSDTFRLERRWLYRIAAFFPLLVIPAFVLWGEVAGIASIILVLAINCNLFAFAKMRNDGSFRMMRYFASTLHCAGKLAGLFAKGCPQLSAELSTAAVPFRTLQRSIAVLSFNHWMEEVVGFDFLGVFMLPLLSFGRIAALLPGKDGHIRTLYQVVGEVDLACALCSYRQSLHVFCEPEFLHAHRVEFEDITHPLIANAVPNSAHFEGDLLLTGSNASGKSTFIKALALNLLCAQTVGTCTAARFALCSGPVATSMAVADSVVDGDSYFVAEIKSMQRLVRLADSGRFCWLFIDEILKGTNTVERVAASAAVLAQLHTAPCLTFAATHDGELCGILHSEYENAHFRETVTCEGVFFDYRLYIGPAQSRNAILLLERMDFPGRVTKNARMFVAHFERTGEWPSSRALTHSP